MRPRISALGILLALTATLYAQAPTTATSIPDLEKAKLDVSRLEDLVREGAVARNKLDQAKSRIADAEDDAILKRTLFGKLAVDDLNPEQMEQMMAAAQRRVDRLQQRVDAMRKLVDQGVLARAELTLDLDELEMRKQTLALAESRQRTFTDLLATIRAEQEAEARAAEARAQAGVWKAAERYDGNGRFQLTMLKVIAQAYEKKFERELPISAMGMTELHRSLGFDHRERVDVALSPDSEEGLWLRKFLETNRVPYFAFRSFIPGQATAPHIHIGPPSLRLPRLVSGS